MRSAVSSLATLVVISLAGTPAVAQVNQPLLTVSPNLVEVAIPRDEFKSKVENQGLAVKLRPNRIDTTPYFVYAQNSANEDRTLVVELRDGASGKLLAEGRAEKVPGGHWRVVHFTPPPVAPAPVVIPPAPGAEAVVTDPPPPGMSVARGPAGFSLGMKLFDIDDKGSRNEVAVGNQPVEQTLSVDFLNPTDYVSVGELTTTDEKTSVIKLTPTQPGISTAVLSFPEAKNGAPPAGAEGVFAITLGAAGKSTVNLGGVFPNGLVPMNLAIDGVARVKVFGTATSADQKSVILPITERRVRVVPVGVSAATTPTVAYHVRIETDNAHPGDMLELHIRRKGASTASDDVLLIGGPRDEKLWVDVSEPTKQGLAFATKTTDWVKSLDLTAARGEIEIEAVLKPKDDKEVNTPLYVVVDAAPPAVAGALEVGDPAKPKEKAFKGATLPVRATVRDVGGAGVEKVSFVLFSKLTSEGTVPPDAIIADGVRLPMSQGETEASDEWGAELPLPDKKGKYLVAVVATDKAGNVSAVTKADPAVKVIELIDPLTGYSSTRGSISGIVIHGGLPQPGLNVVVGGGDGKAKAVAVTDAKGRFCIPDVLPGSYTVLTQKTNSSKGFSSQADVTVEPEKVALVTLELIRNK